MTIKTALAALALTLAPTLALAECWGDAHKMTSANACAEGQVWSETLATCVAKPTS
jgi:hypothetical protein